MESEDVIINKVANSGLVSFDLEAYYDHAERLHYDLKDNLFQGMILREKDFREFLKSHDWSVYKDKNVAISCSEDAIIPTWAYMLLTLQLAPFAKTVVFGTLEDLEKKLFSDALSRINPKDYQDKKVVVKGCSSHAVPLSAYVEIASILQPEVQSLMFGEPCSTVPLYKKPRAIAQKP